MIIFRNLEERLFAEVRSKQINFIINNSHTVAEQTMKLIEFYNEDDGQYRPHWFSNLAGFIKKTINTYTNAYMAYVCALEDNDILEFLGSGDLNNIKIKYSSADKFITKVKIETINDSECKYKKWVTKVDDFVVTNDSYKDYFKYISFCLCGVMEPDDWNPGDLWDRDYILNSGKFPTIEELPKEFKYTKSSNIQTLLENCIGNIVQYVDYSKRKKKD